MFQKGTIAAKKIGFYLKGNELTVGGEDSSRIVERYSYSATGLKDGWELGKALRYLGCGYYSVNFVAGVTVKFSTASPYVRVDMGTGFAVSPCGVEVAKSVAIELKRNGLTCAVDDSSGLILCEKKGIRVSDFPDLRLQIQTDQFTIPAAELVEIVPFLPASALVVNNRGEQGDIQAARTDFARRLHPGHAVLPIVLHHTGAYGRLQWIDRDLHACVLT